MQSTIVAIAFVVACVAAAAIVLGRITQPVFSARPLLNKSEGRLFWILVQAVPRDWRVMTQVSYGEFLSCASGRKFFSINAKRADFVLCDREFDPVAVIEYQGRGHFGKSRRSRADANRRDRQKRRALKEAGIPMIEVPAEFSAQTVAVALSEALPGIDQFRSGVAS